MWVVWVASTTTRVQFSLLSGPISTRVATRTTTVNKFCSTCVETKSAMEQPPSEWGIEDRIKPIYTQRLTKLQLSISLILTANLQHTTVSLCCRTDGFSMNVCSLVPRPPVFCFFLVFVQYTYMDSCNCMQQIAQCMSNSGTNYYLESHRQFIDSYMPRHADVLYLKLAKQNSISSKKQIGYYTTDSLGVNDSDYPWDF